MKNRIKMVIFHSIRKDMVSQMDNFQREQIRKLRSQGLGYKAIGKMVGLSRDSVRNYCKRNPDLFGFGKAVKQMLENKFCNQPKCLECQNNFELNHKGRTKQFCSASCRRKNWVKKHPEKADSHFCKLCGMSFTTYGNPQRKYCSRSCARNSRRS